MRYEPSIIEGYDQSEGELISDELKSIEALVRTIKDLLDKTERGEELLEHLDHVPTNIESYINNLESRTDHLLEEIGESQEFSIQKTQLQLIKSQQIPHLRQRYKMLTENKKVLQ